MASISCNDQWNNSLSVSHLTHLGGQMEELRYIGDYCDHFTIIVLSLTKNDPPKSDPEKNETRGICKGHIQSSYRVLGYKSAVNMFLMSDTFPFRFMLETCVHLDF